MGSTKNSAAGATITQASRAVNESTEYYIKLRSDNKNNRGAYFSIPTIGNQYDYTIEFDMALCAPYYETSNINWLIITGTSGTDLAVLNVPSTNSSTTHSPLNIYDSQTLSSTIATCDHGTRGTVGWYHVTLSVTSANGVKMSVTKEGGSSVLSNYTLSSSKENISKLTIWLNPGYISDSGPHAAISNFVKKTTYSAMYSYAKSEYDTRVASLEALGQTYWSNNVTAASSVTTSALYDEAIAALPTTYLAAVKAQGAGGDMTEAMPTGNAGWTVNQGNGPASYGSTGATETYLNGPQFSTGNIMSQTITGLPNGLYQVQFYGIVNSANNISTVEGSDLVQAYANNVNLDIDVVKQNSCTPTDYLRTIQAEVTDGTLTYGLKVKDEVTDAGNWAVAKTYKLTFLGDTKYNYTINAVAGETTIKQLSTGSEYPGLDYGVYVPYVILYDSKYYVLDDNSTYYKSFTQDAANEIKEISYTLDETIAYFSEYNNLTNSKSYGTETSKAAYSSGNGYGLYQAASSYSGTISSTISAVYDLELAVVARNTNKTDKTQIKAKNGDVYLGAYNFNHSSNTGTYTYSGVYIPAGYSLYMVDIATGNSNAYYDYIILRVNEPKTAIYNAIADCKANESSSEFATAIDAETFSSVNEVYAFHTQWQVNNGTPSKAILNNEVTSADHWWGTLTEGANYEGAPDTKYLSHANAEYNVNQIVYQLPVGAYHASVWTYSSLGGNSGYRKIYVSRVPDEGAWVDYFNPAATSSGWVKLEGDFTLTEPTNVAFGLYASNVADRTAGFDNWALTKIANVSKTISAAGWATYCSPYALDFSEVEGLTAYIVTGGADGKLTKSVVTSVPAGTGVLLKGAAGDYTIPVAASSATNVTGNKLTGVTTQTQIDANTGYVLMNGSEGVAFYKNAKAFTVGANTAYLQANFTTNAARAFFSFGDDATDIRLIENGKMENSVYDLQGRRVSQPTKGLYIKDGKVVVVK